MQLKRAWVWLLMNKLSADDKAVPDINVKLWKNYLVEFSSLKVIHVTYSSAAHGVSECDSYYKKTQLKNK